MTPRLWCALRCLARSKNEGLKRGCTRRPAPLRPQLRPGSRSACTSPAHGANMACYGTRQDDRVDHVDLPQALRAVVTGEVDTSARRRAEYSSDASNYRRGCRSGVVGAGRPRRNVAAALGVMPGVRPAGDRARRRHVDRRPGHRHRRGHGLHPAHESAAGDRPGRAGPPGSSRVLVLDDPAGGAAAPHGLTFGPDPSTHSRCTLGGMIGNNACGSHSVAWGTTADNVLALDVLTYRGEAVGLRAPEGAPGRGPDRRSGRSPGNCSAAGPPGGPPCPTGCGTASPRLADGNLAPAAYRLPATAAPASPDTPLDRLLPEHGRGRGAGASPAARGRWAC